MKNFMFYALFALGACTTVPENGSAPEAAGQKAPLPKTSLAEYKERLLALPEGSACAAYKFKERSKAPMAYLKGMTLSFARSSCLYKKGDASALATGQKDRKNAQYDTLTNYAPRFKALGMDINKDGLDTLRAVYVLGIGLGMRESSGKHCCGRDMSAGFSKSETAETGTFQFSMNSMGAWPTLAHIYAKYRANESLCELPLYSKDIACRPGNEKTWGDEPKGRQFQEFTKRCPAFATEYAMLTVRTLFRHYGPLRTGAAEIEPSCNMMLKTAQAMVEEHPELCEVL